VSAPAGEAFADRRVRDLLDALEQPQAVPAGGTAAALVAASAASVVTMVARSSTQWADGRGVAAQARHLRSRLVPLAEANADALEAALAAFAGSAETRQERRDAELGRALAHAAELPLAIAEAAADVAALASLAAERGDPRARLDAVVAAVLAEGATTAAAGLVERNLAIRGDDERSMRAGEAKQVASSARTSALEA
jgi:methenyltetrahydrofolate cyclohydrolase